MSLEDLRIIARADSERLTPESFRDAINSISPFDAWPANVVEAYAAFRTDHSTGIQRVQRLSELAAALGVEEGEAGAVARNQLAAMIGWPVERVVEALELCSVLPGEASLTFDDAADIPIEVLRVLAQPDQLPGERDFVLANAAALPTDADDAASWLDFIEYHARIAGGQTDMGAWAEIMSLALLRLGRRVRDLPYGTSDLQVLMRLDVFEVYARLVAAYELSPLISGLLRRAPSQGAAIDRLAMPAIKQLLQAPRTERARVLQVAVADTGRPSYWSPRALAPVDSALRAANPAAAYGIPLPSDIDSLAEAERSAAGTWTQVVLAAHAQWALRSAGQSAAAPDVASVLGIGADEAACRLEVAQAFPATILREHDIHADDLQGAKLSALHGMTHIEVPGLRATTLKGVARSHLTREVRADAEARIASAVLQIKDPRTSAWNQIVATRELVEVQSLLGRPVSQTAIGRLAGKGRETIRPYMRLAEQLDELEMSRLGVTGDVLHGLRLRDLRQLADTPSGAERLAAAQAIMSRRRRNADFFSIINSESKAYWLGFLYADGHRTKDGEAIIVELAECDLEHLESFARIFNAECYPRKGRESVVCKIDSKQLVGDLTKLGFTNRKSYDGPTDPLRLTPPPFKKHFLRGFLDGDGAIPVDRNRQGAVRYGVQFNGHIHMLAAVQKQLVHALGLEPKDIKPRKKGGTFGRLEWRGNQIARYITGYLYDGATVALPRKAQLAQDLAELVPSANPRNVRRSAALPGTQPEFHEDAGDAFEPQPTGGRISSAILPTLARVESLIESAEAAADPSPHTAPAQAAPEPTRRLHPARR